MKKIQKNYIKKNLVKLIILFITFVSFDCTTSTTTPTTPTTPVPTGSTGSTGPTGPDPVEPISSTCLPTEEPVGNTCKTKCNASQFRGVDGVCMELVCWQSTYQADTSISITSLTVTVASLQCIGPGVIVMSVKAGDGGGGGSGAKHSNWANSNSGEIGYTGEIKVCTLSLNAATDISDLILSIGNAGEGGIGGNAYFPMDPPPDAAGEGGKKGNDSSVASPSITCTAQGGAGGNGGAFSENNYPGGRQGGSGYMGGGQNGGLGGMGLVDGFSGNKGGNGSPGYIKLEFRKR